MEIVTALLLFLNGSMIEHVYKADLKSCNESKIMAESVVNSNSVVFVCKKVKAKVTIDEGTNTKKIVKVLDDKHLAIPDRPGNRRADTFENLISNPQVAIIFFVSFS